MENPFNHQIYVSSTKKLIDLYRKDPSYARNSVDYANKQDDTLKYNGDSGDVVYIYCPPKIRGVFLGLPIACQKSHVVSVDERILTFFVGLDGENNIDVILHPSSEKAEISTALFDESHIYVRALKDYIRETYPHYTVRKIPSDH